MLGDIFIAILTNYFESGKSTDLEDVCKKEPSFAGFWFEEKFFSHYKRPQTNICVKPITFNSLSVRMIQSSRKKVRFILQENVLYELKKAHPIIDSVGYLSDTASQKWLVFIQISLQSYSEQTKLSKLFRCYSGNPDNKSWSLYTHYRYAIKVAFTSSTPVLLL